MLRKADFVNFYLEKIGRLLLEQLNDQGNESEMIEDAWKIISEYTQLYTRRPQAD